jgi:retron-type reverse transcriptase
MSASLPSAIAASDVATLFAAFFSAEALLDAFQRRFAESPSKGLDRLNGFQFAQRAAVEFDVVSKKCLSGDYRFTPYLEKLKIKGRGKAPRLIAIPTVRDRVVLHQLKVLISSVFPDAVPKNIANTYVRMVAKDLAIQDPNTTYVCGCDIKDFYGSINRAKMLNILSKRIKHMPAITLLGRALVCPTVPKNVRRRDHKKYADSKGIPQGLAISNILAAIYVYEVDDGMRNMGVAYYRYVDDVLMYGPELAIRKAYKSLGARLRRRNLSLHPLGSSKGHLDELKAPFGYLGYQFR